MAEIDVPARITLEEVYMRMAEELAKRSTCSRLQVGTVITSSDLTQVLGIGYNGNAKGLPNACDSEEPGKCGCIHSEANALLKSGAHLPGKKVFVTFSPCVMCSKMIVNSNVSEVYYRDTYRDPEPGFYVFKQAGIKAYKYDSFRNLWR